MRVELESIASAPAEPAPVVRVEAVSKSFGAHMVLKGVSMDARAGEVVCLIGPSGSGKSTLLRCINGLEIFQEGAMDVVGQRLIGIPKPNRGDHVRHRAALQNVRRQVGMVFQQFNLFPHLTALQNVSLGPKRVLGKSKAEAEEAGRALMKKVGLEGKEELASRQALRRAAATRGDRPGAGDGAEAAAHGRNHFRSRSGTGRRGAARGQDARRSAVRR